MRTVQADSCLNSEQIDTLFISVGGQGNWGGAPEFYWATCTKNKMYFWNPELKPSRLAPLLGYFIKGGGLGAWS